MSFYFFFFNDTATTEIYTLSLHDPLPISGLKTGHYKSKKSVANDDQSVLSGRPSGAAFLIRRFDRRRSEEHTSELQPHSDLVCRLLLVKKIDYVVLVTLSSKSDLERFDST